MPPKPKQIQAAFQGELGAFSHEAAMRLLGPQVQVRPCQRFDEVFQSLKDGKVDAAVVPIENTLHGSVHENYDHLLHFDHKIVAETSVRIVHNLIAAPGVRFKDIRRAFSHPVALNQCLHFLATNTQMERVPFYDTAGSVKMVMAEGLKDAAAIASAVSATIYGAHILKRSIEDDRQNFTRFFLLRRADQPELNLAEPGKKNWKTSLVFSTRNQPGSLFRALSAFALRDLSLTKIESRPLRGKPWEYLFYVDFLGSIEEERVKKALGHLQELADLLRVLGCYRA
ncbi:prephenate dehydratase [uncultured Paludibaculum sp.]|uniref:prephenate dehydratase n=1 Tax=uncultured Paludibaculum sp. TaxID=1765020 RepID=UPI002AABF281|nr:prephenate dehydratase [uncultured Paludibaculum sp.]